MQLPGRPGFKRRLRVDLGHHAARREPDEWRRRRRREGCRPDPTPSVTCTRRREASIATLNENVVLLPPESPRFLTMAGSVSRLGLFDLASNSPDGTIATEMRAAIQTVVASGTSLCIGDASGLLQLYSTEEIIGGERREERGDPMLHSEYDTTMLPIDLPDSRGGSAVQRPLHIHIETPTKGRGGCSRMTVSPTDRCSRELKQRFVATSAPQLFAQMGADSLSCVLVDPWKHTMPGIRICPCFALLASRVAQIHWQLQSCAAHRLAATDP